MTIIDSIVVKECPFCKKLIGQWSQASGNTFSGTHWTDGKSIYPMMMKNESLVKTNCCNNVIDINNINKVGRVALMGRYHKDDVYLDKEIMKELQSYRDLEFADYMNIINSTSLTPEEEKNNRMHAWWAGNDKRRLTHNAEWKKWIFDKDDFFGKDCLMQYEIPEQEKDNLGKLFDLLDSDNEKELLAKAEIKRQLGDFSESKNILEKVNDSSLIKYVETIKTLCDANDSFVSEIYY